MLSYGQQEAMFLGEELADTEHVLLGLVRVAHEHHDCGFARIVGFHDRLRIRNEILRLVARPPDPADVVRRKAKAAVPAGEFEIYAVKLLCDALENIPAGEASAISHMRMRFSFDEQDSAQPVIEVEWKVAEDGERAENLGDYMVRIPPSRAGAQRGMVLRRRWVEGVSRSTQKVGGVDLTGREGEIERVLMALAHSVNSHLHDSDVLWDVVGHSIGAVFPAPSHRDAETGSAKWPASYAGGHALTVRPMASSPLGPRRARPKKARGDALAEFRPPLRIAACLGSVEVSSSSSIPRFRLRTAAASQERRVESCRSSTLSML
jgi:hypothetical protein